MHRYLAIASHSEDLIHIVELQDYKMERTISLPQAKGVFRLIYHEGCIYHIDSFSDTVGKINLATNRQTVLSTGAYPSDLCMHEGMLYVSCGEANSIWAFSMKPFEPQFCTSAQTFPISLCCDGEKIYCAMLYSGKIMTYDLMLQLINERQILVLPLSICCSDSAYVLCVSDNGSTLALMKDGEIKKQKVLTSPAIQMHCMKNGNIVIAHTWENSISLYDKELNLLASAKSSAMPDCIALDEFKKKIYISAIKGNCIDIFDFSLNRLGKIPTCQEPRGLALI